MVHCTACGRPTQNDGAHRRCPHCGHTDYINPAPAVGVAIVRDGRVLLAKRARAPKAGMWDLIGGFVDAGETFPEAARREAKEETGLDIRDLRRLHQAPGMYGPDQPTLNIHYAAEADGEPEAHDDVAEVRWFALDDLPELAWDHEQVALERLTRG